MIKERGAPDVMVATLIKEWSLHHLQLQLGSAAEPMSLVLLQCAVPIDGSACFWHVRSFQDRLGLTIGPSYYTQWLAKSWGRWQQSITDDLRFPALAVPAVLEGSSSSSQQQP